MPNGKTHDKITLVLAPVVFILTYVLTNHFINTLIIFLSYLFASFMFNGDLDTNSKPYNRWWLFKMIWIPYQLLFAHRSVFTHGIIIGTLIRIVYLLVIPVIFLLLNNSLVYYINLINWDMFLIVLIGLEIGSTIHTISDKTF